MDAPDPDPRSPEPEPSEPQPSDSVPAVRSWPPHEELDVESSLAAQCTGCGAPWRIHRDMAGFKLRCSCGTYIEVPRLPEPLPAALIDSLHAAGESRDIMLAPEITEDDQGRLELSAKPGEVLDREMPTSAPMAPGTVQKGNVRTQQRWTNAAFLELALMMGAFLLPALAINLIFDGEARTLAMPFASLVTGIAVVMIAAAMSPFAFSGMRRTQARFFVEAIAVAGVFFLLAQGWMHLVDTKDEGGAMMRALRTALGTGWFLFVLSFTPAVFEEIAFRGVVQGRFYALLGRFQGLIATGAAFGLCHGITAALPFHVGIGIYLCWLRERSASLWPCMLMHGVYNAAIGLSS